MNAEMRKQLGIEENKPTDWFEELYSRSDESGTGIAWANMAPHPLFKKWVDTIAHVKNKKKALVVGCGLGDDAVELEKKGYSVTAFDVSESAIELCKKRFPESKVSFLVANLLEGIPEWSEQFDLVLEIFTIQALPPKYETTIIQSIANFVAPKGELVLIAKVQKEKRCYENGPPWRLNENYIELFEKYGLEKMSQSITLGAKRGGDNHFTVFRNVKK